MILCVRVGSLYNFKMLYENSELLTLVETECRRVLTNYETE